MYFNKREDIKEVYVGEICVFVGLKDMLIGDMFCDEKNVVVLERMEFFELVIYIVVEFKMKVDQEKMGVVLGKFVEEDLSFRVMI